MSADLRDVLKRLAEKWQREPEYRFRYWQIVNYTARAIWETGRPNAD